MAKRTTGPNKSGSHHIGFAKLKRSIAAKGDVTDPGAVAAAIGIKKMGKQAFFAKAAAARRHKGK